MAARIFLLWFVLEALAVYAVVAWAGVLGALLLAIMGSAAGGLMLRGEGIALVTRLAVYMRRAQETGEVPPPPIADTLPRFIAGLLLLTPGFSTDVLALLVLLPPIRDRVVRRVQRVIVERHHATLRERGIVDTTGVVLPDGLSLESEEETGDGPRTSGDPDGAPRSPPKLGGGPRFKIS